MSRAVAAESERTERFNGQVGGHGDDLQGLRAKCVEYVEAKYMPRHGC